MVAYVIFLKERTRRPAEIETYKQMAPAGMAGYPVTFRMTHGRKEIVEGPEFEDMMPEFPSFEEAKTIPEQRRLEIYREMNQTA